MKKRTETIDDAVVGCRLDRNCVTIITKGLGRVEVPGDLSVTYNDITMKMSHAISGYERESTALTSIADDRVRMIKDLTQDLYEGFQRGVGGLTAAVPGGAAGIFVMNQLLGAGDNLIYNPLSASPEGFTFLVIADVIGAAVGAGLAYMLVQLVSPKGIPILGDILRYKAKKEYNHELKEQREKLEVYENILVLGARYASQPKMLSR